jgi:hypothetical protein
MRNNLGVKTSREEISTSNEGDTAVRTLGLGQCAMAEKKMVAREGRGRPEVAQVMEGTAHRRQQHTAAVVQARQRWWRRGRGGATRCGWSCGPGGAVRVTRGEGEGRARQ